jgi:hypothetical protein
MKTNKIIIIILAFISSISFTSCVEDGDFTVPEALGSEENANLKTLLASGAEMKTIKQVKDLFISGQATQITQNFVVKGYVSSSDRTGNFYKEFFLQDDPTNPTTALKVVLELADAYNKYNFGREVYINLKDLYIGETRSGDGVIAIGGDLDGSDVENLSVNQIETNLLRSENTETLAPLKLTLSQISSKHVGIYVQIDNAQFPENIAGKTTYFDKTETFDTKRDIESCEGFGYVTFPLETSAFADFKFSNLPSGGGSIKAVVSKTFDGSQVVLALNDVEDVNMDGARCTPLDINQFPSIFSEDFENTSGSINITDWTNYSEAGTELWESYFDSNSSSRAARVGSFRSNNASTISWLITKGINLDNTTQEFLSFETSNSFSDGSDLELLISTDWDGTTAGVTSATWQSLPGKIVDDSENFRNFVSSGYVDLSAFSGTAYIAFKYTGSGDAAFDGTFEVDNLAINAQ